MYRIVKDTMRLYYTLEWPADPVRDAVQAWGMAFCQQWKRSTEAITEIVLSDPELFPEFHVADKRGQTLNPWDYSSHHIIMPRLTPVQK